MRAVEMTAAGGPGVLRLADVPEPQVTGERDVKVRLRAAGINPVDYKLRSGGTIGGVLPAVLGWDGAGIVESTGPGVSRFGAGDEVYFCDGGFGPVPGTYQEVKVIDERLLARKPRRLSFIEAAAAPLVTITAWEALRERARVDKDQHVLVQAGAGGVGHMSVQIARLAGARVATTVTPGPKAELASSLGAELCIDYTRQDVGERLRAWTGTDGADVVHDTVGGRTFTACFLLVRPYGDLVSNVESPWEDAAIEAMQKRNLRVSFTWMPAPSVFGWAAHRVRQRGILEEAAAHFDAGELRVQVGATFPLERAADAHRALEAGQVTGKAVLTMDA
ncbi:zinc-binding dehydrogenase [Trebonia sp.]|uniref:zinc-binding dehydrogenase n=1 Tax=Trebonia sp. TaxID=2767075 RepID=UPI00261F3921|nr:zinc-binding dehydrogenase [Trebonia sp.]